MKFGKKKKLHTYYQGGDRVGNRHPYLMLKKILNHGKNLNVH